MIVEFPENQMNDSQNSANWRGFPQKNHMYALCTFQNILFGNVLTFSPLDRESTSNTFFPSDFSLPRQHWAADQGHLKSDWECASSWDSRRERKKKGKKNLQNIFQRVFVFLINWLTNKLGEWKGEKIIK